MRAGIISLLTLFLLLAGCDRKGGDTGPLNEVRIGYFANLTHAQAVLGVASGDFANAVAPAKLKTTLFNAGPSLIEAVFAGEIDLGYIGPGPAINGYTRSQGKGLRIIAGAAANGVLIVARKDSGIESLADLKNKKLATPQRGNTQDISARHYLTAVLGQPNAEGIVPIDNSQQLGLMLRKQIDAAWAPEPWGSRLVVEADGRIIGEEKDLWPEKELTLTVIIVRPAFLQAHPEVVQKILGVHCDWTKRLQQDPKALVPQLSSALFDLTGYKLPPGVLDQAITHVKFTNDPLEPTLRTMAQWSYDLGFIREQPSLQGLTDLTLLRKVESPATRPSIPEAPKP